MEVKSSWFVYQLGPQSCMYLPLLSTCLLPRTCPAVRSYINPGQLITSFYVIRDVRLSGIWRLIIGPRPFEETQ